MTKPKVDAPQSPESEDQDHVKPSHIVGVGASAGGLEALMEFFTNLPPDTGMAFLVVMHFDPKHESLSAKLLAPTTRMPVHEAVHGETIRPNHVYIIPPDRTMRYQGGTIALTPLEGPRQRVIDIMLQSLAEAVMVNAVAVILSGSGSDGAKGMAAVWRVGGMTYVQDPSTAKFDSMPTSAIATKAVAETLSPADIGRALGRLGIHGAVDVTDEGSPAPGAWLQQLFAIVRREKHVDFSQYKYTTLMRRIHRRMKVLHLDSPIEYVQYCATHPEEVETLFTEFLITVTRFFRDPELFDALCEQVLRPILGGKEAGAPVRFWSVGCSSGEEVYSLAMALVECMEDGLGSFPVQIFGTDMDETALQVARVGHYPQSIEEDVSPRRLARFFRKTPDGGYQVVKSIREMCTFSRHDITRDPPFAKMDLVVCRNLLIYFSPQLQDHVFTLFHYALNPTGMLWLGKGESIGGATVSGLFRTQDRGNRFFAKVPVHTPFRTRRFAKSPALRDWTPVRPKASERTVLRQAPSAQADVERMILDRFSPPSLVIDDHYNILYSYGKTEPFLQKPSGPTTNDLLRLARSDYVARLRQAVDSAKEEARPASSHVYLGGDKPESRFQITVTPLESLKGERNFLIVFSDMERIVTVKQAADGADGDPAVQEAHGDEPGIPAHWMADLQAARDYQQKLILDYSRTQEELVITNEDLQSSNEELQSTVEEL